ncbi:MAG TPA: hypothetical protein VN752_04985 [Solirubrobacterales bacterium]|nr:hypothetical protein [Solirubrobacterales bacterium]
MREAINSNPLAQAAIIGVLLLAAAFFMMSRGGGEEGEEVAPEGAPALSVSTEAEAAAPTAVPPLPPSPESAAKLPKAVVRAFAANQTVVLLFFRNGGIDDRLVAGTVKRVSALPGVAPFVVPAGQIARYAAVAQGVAVDRVPALVVVRPKRLNDSVPVASVHYGFQSPQSVVQAIVDAGYKGRTLDYHP